MEEKPQLELPQLILRTIFINVSFLWLLALPANGQNNNSPETSSQLQIPKVKVNISTNLIEGVLPFDSPFILEGEFENWQNLIIGHRNINNRSLRIAERKIERLENKISRSKIDSENFQTWTKDLNKKLKNFSNSFPKPSDIPFTNDTIFNPTGDNKFGVFINGLQPEEIYQFKFDFTSSLGKEKAQLFNDRIVASLDNYFWSTSNLSHNQITDAELFRIRNDWIKTIHAVVPKESMKIKSGSIFDSNTANNIVKIELQRVVQPLYQYQKRIKNQIDQYTKQQASLLSSLQSLANNLDLKTLRNKLSIESQDIKSNYQNIAKQGLDLVDFFLKNNNIRLQLIAKGHDPEDFGNQKELTNVRSELDLNSFIENYVKLEQSIADLSFWLKNVLDLGANMNDINSKLKIDDKIIINLQGPVIVDLENIRQLSWTIREGTLRVILRNLPLRYRAISSTADSIQFQANNEITLHPASTYSLSATPATNYVSIDAGFLYTPLIGDVVPYLGANIYFRPINKSAPLSKYGSFWHRFAVTAGITLKSFSDDLNTREDLIGNKSVVLGMGFRFTESFRIGAGTVLFNRQDPNPFVDRTQCLTCLSFTPYLSVSIDWNVVKTFIAVTNSF